MGKKCITNKQESAWPRVEPETSFDSQTFEPRCRNFHNFYFFTTRGPYSCNRFVWNNIKTPFCGRFYLFWYFKACSNISKFNIRVPEWKFQSHFSGMFSFFMHLRRVRVNRRVLGVSQKLSYGRLRCNLRLISTDVFLATHVNARKL